MAPQLLTELELKRLLANAEYRNLPSAKERALKLVLEESTTIQDACLALSGIESVTTRSIQRAKKAISEGKTPFQPGKVPYLTPEQESELIQFLVEQGKTADPFHESEVLTKVCPLEYLLIRDGFLPFPRSDSVPFPLTHLLPSTCSNTFPGRANSTRCRSEGRT